LERLDRIEEQQRNHLDRLDRIEARQHAHGMHDADCPTTERSDNPHTSVDPTGECACWMAPAKSRRSGRTRKATRPKAP